VERHATIDIPHDAALAVPDFEDAHPVDILRWAGDQFGDGIVVTASFGDAALVHLVSQAVPQAEVVLLDTGYLFAETEWYAEELRRAYDLNLRVVAPPADAVHNLWQTDTDACCAARKVAPLQQALAGKTAWITGLRRADSPSRADAPIVHFDPFREITKINPMATWSDEEVAHYNAIELLPEHPLTAKGYVSIGCWPCTRPVKEGEDVRAGRWSGSGKTECGLHSSPGSTTGGVAEPDPT
jgi:phosphoadenosine phosphosulfate reductase